MHHASLLLHFFLWIEETLVRTKLTKVWFRKQVFVWTLKVTGSAEGAAEQHSYLMGWWRGTAPRKWFSLTARKAAANLKMILIVQKEFSERLKNAATSSEWSVADERWWYLRLFKNLSDSSRTIDSSVSVIETAELLFVQLQCESRCRSSCDLCEESPTATRW